MQPDAAQAFIERFVAVCRADERVIAAVVEGSYAAGTADAYSDLDLGLFIADSAHADFLARRADFVRQLGEPLLLEDFDLPDIVFAIFAGGTDVELRIGRASQPAPESGATVRVLLDKAGILPEAARAQPRAEQTEALRRQVYWFWHDVAHFVAAMGRGQLWWAHGQLDELRRCCIDLARLRVDFLAEAEGYWKVEEVLPIEYLAALQDTFCLQERSAMLRAARAIIRFYEDLAPPLALQHGIAYPEELARVMLARLRTLDAQPLVGD